MRRRGGWRVRRLALIPLVLFAVGGCGSESEVLAYEVTQTTFSDCSQVGAGAVQCDDAEALQAVRTTGRWIFDYRGIDTFTLTTDTGQVLPGVYFANDGRTRSPFCVGQGGTCHFARSRTDQKAPETGCLQIRERVIDLFILKGELQGQMSDVQVTDESCGTSNIREVLVELRGVVLDEPVHAREKFTP